MPDVLLGLGANLGDGVATIDASGETTGGGGADRSSGGCGCNVSRSTESDADVVALLAVWLVGAARQRRRSVNRFPSVA